MVTRSSGRNGARRFYCTYESSEGQKGLRPIRSHYLGFTGVTTPEGEVIGVEVISGCVGAEVEDTDDDDYIFPSLDITKEGTLLDLEDGLGRIVVHPCLDHEEFFDRMEGRTYVSPSFKLALEEELQGIGAMEQDSRED